MTETELLLKVKTALGISGDFHDETLQIYIDSVKEFMHSSGVDEAVINSSVSVGCIIAGVNDLYNYSSGEVKFSDFTIKRIIQLSYKTAEEVADYV